jgi:hypothetical protein
MRIPRLALVVAAAAIGWSSVVVVASAAPPKCADLEAVQIPAAPVPVATPAPSQLCQIVKTDPAYSLNITFPLDFPDQTAVSDYVKQTRDGFLNVAKSSAPHDMPYELDTTMTQYGSSVPPRSTQTVVFKTYQSVGGAHPQTFYRAFNWDQGNRRPITIDNLFREATAPFPLILPVVQAEATKQFGQDAAISPGAGLDPSKYQNFAITNDAIIFFFDQGALLPEAAGAFEVSVPRGAIDSMLT